MSEVDREKRNLEAWRKRVAEKDKKWVERIKAMEKSAKKKK